MRDQWRRPNAFEAAQGYIAMQKVVFYCIKENGELKAVDYSGGYETVINKERVFIPRRTVWEGVTVQGMERWVQRGESLPYWITKREKELV